MEGWIKLHRKIEKWEWYHDDFLFKFFITLVIDANYEDFKFEGRVIKRGQLVTGRKKLMQTFRTTAQRVRTALQKLKSTNEITIETTNKYSIITITNYECYAQVNQPANQRTTNEQPTNNQRITTIKEVKKEKKEKNIYSATKEFVAEVVTHLNDAVGSKYKADAKKTNQVINARFKEGYDLEDFKTVVDKKTRKWKNDSEMSGFLRPSTLFGTKFEEYLNEIDTSKTIVREDDGQDYNF